MADEINCTLPRTQAELLEAMQEYQVTVGGVRHELERPLFVLGTVRLLRDGVEHIRADLRIVVPVARVVA